MENNTLQKFADDVSILDADNSLVPLADATVTVYDAGTTNLASIFSDNGVTSASNPLTVGDDGSFEFYAANGRYDLLVEKSPYKPHHEYDITLHDIEDDVIDEDDMASDSDAKVPTQQSVKAYVDSLVILYGTVTLANTRLSLVNGAAFFDPSVVSLLTELLGCKLTVTSKSTGAKIVGYIKAAGTGETLGDEKITNGDFATGDGTGWTEGGLATSNEDYTGNELTVTITSTGSKIFAQTQTLANNALYKSTVAVRDYSCGGRAIYTRFGGSTNLTANITANGTFSGYAVKTAAYLNFSVGNVSSLTSGDVFTVDDISLKQVLTPSTTGVTITSTPGGTTYNWASIEAGFNYNDASGYTYKVSPAII